MKLRSFILFTIVLLLVNSCSIQNLYRTETEGDINQLLENGQDFVHTIKTDDKVSLSIWNHDDMSMGSLFSIYNSNEAFGKWVLVDSSGFAKLPKIGNYPLAGLTCVQAADSLTPLYSQYLVDPVIVVKILNREVTVLGEVRTPGTYVLEKERNTLSEMIGKAQGFTNFANMEELQLIRNDTSYVFDITNFDDYRLHELVVQSGDIIHAPSRRAKATSEKLSTIIPFASALTAISVAASLILR